MSASGAPHDVSLSLSRRPVHPHFTGSAQLDPSALYVVCTQRGIGETEYFFQLTGIDVATIFAPGEGGGALRRLSLSGLAY